MNLAHDLRYAFRQLAKHPAVTFAAIASLALGIGGNAAVFSVIDAVLLRSMPVEAPSQLFALMPDNARPQRYSYPLFQRFQSVAGGRPLAAMTRVQQTRALLKPGAEPESVNTQLVSGSYFPTLGLKPAIGRLLNDREDEGPTAQAVAVVSYDFWKQRLDGTQDVIGRTLSLNGQRLSIIGVAPASFHGVWLENRTEVWVPLAMQAPLHYAQNYGNHNGFDPDKPWLMQEQVDWLEILARTPVATVPALQSQLNAVYRRTLEEQFGDVTNATVRQDLVSRRIALQAADRGFSNLRQRFSAPLYVLMAMVGLVLLIACVNVANLLMARAAARRREIALRMSLGASRGQLVRQLVVEALVLAVLSAAAGLLVAQWGSRLLVAGVLGPSVGTEARALPFFVGVDARVLTFTSAIALVTVLVFGLVPAFRATRVELSGMLAAASRSVYGGSRWNSAKLLVGAQVALSLLLVFGAGLFARSLYNLAHERLGYDTEQVLTAAIDPRSGGYSEQQLPALYRRLVERLNSLPGVRSASVAMCGLAVDCESNSGIDVSGYQPGPNEAVKIQWSFVDHRYFETVGMKMAAGRAFEPADAASKRLVAVVNQSLVNRYFAGRNAIGGQLKNGPVDAEIVGVVQDARVNRVREAAVPMIFYSLEQHPIHAGSLEVRVAGNPESATAAVRRALADVEPGLPVQRITVLSQIVERNLSQDRLIATLTGLFAGLALALACVGLYGVMAHAVARRAPEIGVRMALGAAPATILSGVLKESLAVILGGLALGLPLIWAGAKAAQGLLYEVQSLDALSLAVAIALMTTVSTIAALIPARRAAQVEPMAALREQ